MRCLLSIGKGMKKQFLIASSNAVISKLVPNTDWTSFGGLFYMTLETIFALKHRLNWQSWLVPTVFMTKKPVIWRKWTAHASRCQPISLNFSEVKLRTSSRSFVKATPSLNWWRFPKACSPKRPQKQSICFFATRRCPCERTTSGRSTRLYSRAVSTRSSFPTTQFFTRRTGRRGKHSSRRRWSSFYGKGFAKKGHKCLRWCKKWTLWEVTSLEL